MKINEALAVGLLAVFYVVVPSIRAISEYVRMHKIPKKGNSSD